MAKLSRGPGDDRGPVVWMHGNGTVTDVTYQGQSLAGWISAVALKSEPNSMTMVDLTLVITQVRIIDAPADTRGSEPSNWRDNTFRNDDGVALNPRDFGKVPGETITPAYIRANPQYRWPKWMVKQAGELP